MTDADGVLGATLRSDVAANEPLLRSAIDDAVDDGPAFELALDLDVAQAVGARLRPGDRVLVVAETDDDTVVQLGPALVTSLSTPTEGIGGGSLVVVLGVDDGTLAAELAGLRDVDVRLVRIGAAATPRPTTTCTAPTTIAAAAIGAPRPTGRDRTSSSRPTSSSRRVRRVVSMIPARAAIVNPGAPIWKAT